MNMGDQTADTLAKQALKQEEVMAISLSKCEAKWIIKRSILKEWQHTWDNGETGRHLYAVQHEEGMVRSVKRSTKDKKHADKVEGRDTPNSIRHCS